MDDCFRKTANRTYLLQKYSVTRDSGYDRVLANHPLEPPTDRPLFGAVCMHPSLSRFLWLRLFVCGSILSSAYLASVSCLVAAPPTDELITIERGELPIIISAPHGGRR